MEEGEEERRASDCFSIVDRAIAERMGVRLKGWMRHGQRMVTEICGKWRAG